MRERACGRKSRHFLWARNRLPRFSQKAFGVISRLISPNSRTNSQCIGFVNDRTKVFKLHLRKQNPFPDNL